MAPGSVMYFCGSLCTLSSSSLKSDGELGVSVRGVGVGKLGGKAGGVRGRYLGNVRKTSETGNIFPGLELLRWRLSELVSDSASSS